LVRAHTNVSINWDAKDTISRIKDHWMINIKGNVSINFNKRATSNKWYHINHIRFEGTNHHVQIADIIISYWSNKYETWFDMVPTNSYPYPPLSISWILLWNLIKQSINDLYKILSQLKDHSSANTWKSNLTFFETTTETMSNFWFSN